MEQKSKKIDVKIIVIVIVVIIAIVEGIFIFASNKGTPGEKETKSISSEQDILLDMVKIEIAKYFKYNEKDFKEIDFVRCETIKEYGNIIDIYGNTGYKNLYGNSNYSTFEGEFEKKVDDNGKLLSITTKYLKYGGRTYIDKRYK